MFSSLTMDSRQSKYHVPNLTRALRILELFTSHPEGLTTSQMTALLKIPRNSVFRITATLLAFGYLVRDEETKVFQMSQKLLTVGYAALSEQTLVEKSIGEMRQLRDRFKETVPLGILHGTEGLVIEEIQGLHSFRFVLEPGRRFHLHSAAPGKAIVAFLPDGEKEQLIRKIKFEKYNDRTITDKRTYIKNLETVRKKGYAIDHAEEIEGMHCIAAPILNRHGYPLAAIWLSGPSIRIKEDDFSAIGDEVKKATQRISKSLGFYKKNPGK